MCAAEGARGMCWVRACSLMSDRARFIERPVIVDLAVESYSAVVNFYASAYFQSLFFNVLVVRNRLGSAESQKFCCQCAAIQE